MMRFNRTGSEYSPIGYPGVDWATARPHEGDAHLKGGLFYRNQTFPEHLAAVEACQSGEQIYEQLAIDAFQGWVETGWKKPHATFDAVERLAAKAREEAREVDDALEEFWDTRDKKHLIEELGDYLWVTSGFASNGSVVISDAIKQRLYEYAVGTKVRAENGFTEPDWYDAAISLAAKRGSVTIGDLDNLIREGFVPRYSPVMNLCEEEEICCTNFSFDFQAFSAFMKSFASSQFDYGEGGVVLRNTFEESADGISKLAAETYFRVAAMSHFVGGSLAEVVQTNVDKIAQRIATNSVDKSDPNRQQ